MDCSYLSRNCLLHTAQVTLGVYLSYKHVNIFHCPQTDILVIRAMPYSQALASSSSPRVAALPGERAPTPPARAERSRGPPLVPRSAWHWVLPRPRAYAMPSPSRRCWRDTHGLSPPIQQAAGGFAQSTTATVHRPLRHGQRAGRGRGRQRRATGGGCAGEKDRRWVRSCHSPCRGWSVPSSLPQRVGRSSRGASEASGRTECREWAGTAFSCVEASSEPRRRCAGSL